MKRIEHIGVVVESIADTQQLLERAGLERVAGGEFDWGRTAFFSPGEGARVELIEVADPELRRTRLPEGERVRIEHVAFEVDDLDATIAALAALGIELTGPPVVSGGLRSVWTVPATSGGLALQLCEPAREPS